MTLRIEKLLTAITLWALILCHTNGCFLPLSLPNQRIDTTLVAARDILFFAGGIDGDQFTSRVDVLDTSTNQWTYFNLTRARSRILADSYGTKVIFFGGRDKSGIEVQVVEIYDLNDNTLTSLQLPEPYLFSKVTIGESKAVIFGHHQTAPQVILVLDLITLEFDQLPARDLAHNLGTTNGTHAFLVSTFRRVMDIVNLETLAVSLNPAQTDAQYINIIYSDGYLYLIGVRSVDVASTLAPQLSISNTFQQSLVLGSAAVVINQNVYRFGLGYIITNPFVPYEIQHILSRNVNSQTAVNVNGVIVFDDVLTNGLRRFYMLDTRYTFQRLDLDVSTLVSFAERDTLFYFREPNITTYDTNTRRMTVHPYRAEYGFGSLGTTTRDKLAYVTRADRAFLLYLYDFNTQTMKLLELPSIYAFNDIVGFGDFIILKAIGRAVTYHSIHLINTNSHELTQFQVQVRTFTLYNDTTLAITTPSGVILFDTSTNTTIQTFSLPSPSSTGEIFVAHRFIFVADNYENNQVNALYVIDVRLNTITRRVLSTLTTSMKMVVIDRHVVFTGTVTTQTQPLDVFDAVKQTWKTIMLPRTLSSNTLAVLAIRDKVFVGRLLTIEAVDVEDGVVTSMPFPVFNLHRMTAVGSKLVVYMIPPASTGLTVTIYDVTTGEWTYLTLTRGVQTVRPATDVVSNYVMVNLGDIPQARPYLMPLATLLETFKPQELFMGQSTNFTITTAGPPVHYQWTQNDRIIQDGNVPTMVLNNVTMREDGVYRVYMADHCNFHMRHEARLTVNPVPMFSVPLTNSVVLCDSVEELPIKADGKSVEYKWSIDGATIVNAVEPTLNVSTTHIPCHTQAVVCAYAINPSGQTESCAQVRMLELDSVITGPQPTVSPSTWFSEQVVELSVRVMEQECTSHEWFVNGVNVSQINAQSSTLSVELKPAMEKYQYQVIATCGNSHIKSHVFSFGEVSSLPAYGVALIVVGIFIGIAVPIIVIVILRKRLYQSQDKELELSELLSHAKSDSLIKESMPIINKTTWQWKPTEDFSYKSLDSLPIDIDTSQLKFVEKGEPLEIDMNFSKEIQMSSRARKSKSSILTEKLISGTKIDIYAPQSPKYEVNVEPETLYMEGGDTLSVTVSVRMRMTTRCKVALIVVLEQQKIYSAIEFKLESKMSTWIDLEEIEMSGEFLGGGGFGSVVRGVYRGQDVAVKKLLSQYLTDDMKIEFEREVTLMKSLRHPNIVQFVGASNVKESLAIVIEYAPLGSLASVMEKQSLSVQFKVMCLLETAKALQFLHSNGVIHRDIKPQNILVFSLETRASVHVKLTDFGTSRFIADDPTTVTKNVGTIAFMAPEALGRNPRIDKSADVYSFGVLMWSVLFEQVPFKEFKWDSDIEQHVKSGNRLPFPHGHELDPSLVKLIEECWQHEPKQRLSINVVVQRLSNIK